MRVERIDLFRPRPTQTLPVVLSVDEVWRILDHVHQPAYYACLATIYPCGLRISEAVTLPVSWIDSARMQRQVRGGKGNKDRSIPLPPRTLTLLRRHGVPHPNPVWLFPAGPRAGMERPTATAPIGACGLRRALLPARAEAGVRTHACVHTLRHWGATPCSRPASRGA
ncbi:MAG: tyrosine-type recombinase/integrase [Chloroflexales bacterium]|nr:tyrosine-type recombinase/integrase [Chloroflexales bacterium]